MFPRGSHPSALCMDVGPSCTQGVLGSAGSDLIIFDVDLDQVCDLSSSPVELSPYHSLLSFNWLQIQHVLKEKQVIKLKHPGVGDVKIRRDEKLFVTGGWDHRYVLAPSIEKNRSTFLMSYLLLLLLSCRCLSVSTESVPIDGKMVNPWPFWNVILKVSMPSISVQIWPY